MEKKLNSFPLRAAVDALKRREILDAAISFRQQR